MALPGKSGVNDFLRAFKKCENLQYPLPAGITNYGIAIKVYGAVPGAGGRNENIELPDYEEPLEILSYGVHKLWAGELNFRISYVRQDEFYPVCNDFNEMAKHFEEGVQGLKNQEQSRKELLVGISYDIRSPLTSIKAYTEGLLDGIASTEDMRSQYLKMIKTKSQNE